MYRKLLCVIVIFALLCAACSETKDEGKLLGKWEGKNEQMCEVTKEGGQLYLDHYYLNKSATTAGDNSFIDESGNAIPKGTLIRAGATLNHRKSLLMFDSSEKVYKWDEGKLSVNVKLVDDNHLVMEFPGEHRMYNRVTQ